MGITTITTTLQKKRKRACQLLNSALSDERKATEEYNKLIKHVRKISKTHADIIDNIKSQEEKHTTSLRELHRRLC